MLIWFSGWNLIKFASIAVFVLVSSVRTREAVTSYYSSEAVCTQCYEQAVAQPDVYFEFTRCKSEFTTSLAGDNLMYYRGFWAWSVVNSPVASMVWTTATTLAFLITVYLIILCFAYFLTRFRDQNQNEQPAAAVAIDRVTVLVLTTVLFESSTFFVMLLLSASQGTYQLFMSNGCYVSAWNTSQITLSYVVLSVAVFMWIIDLWITFRWGPGTFKMTFFCMARVCELTWYATSVVLAGINEATSDIPTQLIVNVVLVLSLADVFCLLNDVIIGVRGNGIRRGRRDDYGHV